MVARHQKESRQVQARSGNETYYRYLDTDSERLVTSAIDCATGQLSGAATAEPYPNSPPRQQHHSYHRSILPFLQRGSRIAVERSDELSVPVASHVIDLVRSTGALALCEDGSRDKRRRNSLRCLKPESLQ